MVTTESFFIESAATGRFRRCTSNKLQSSRDNALTVNDQESIEERLFRFSFVVFLFLQGLLSGKQIDTCGCPNDMERVNCDIGFTSVLKKANPSCLQLYTTRNEPWELTSGFIRLELNNVVLCSHRL